MPRTVSRILDATFCFAVVFSIARDWFRQACQQDARSHLFGLTIITHSDQQVVIRDWSNQLTTFTFAQKIDLRWLQSLLAIYIVLWLFWTLWRLVSLTQKPPKSPRGFEVIPKEGK